MALIPMEYDEGGYKFNVSTVTENITSSAYGSIFFPSGRIVLCARVDGQPAVVAYGAGANYTQQYLNGSTVNRIANNTQYSVDYQYLEKVT